MIDPIGAAAGLRIVAVEDEALIALDLQDMLLEAGASEVVIAPDLARLAEILKLNLRPPDIAIVNVEPAHDGAAGAARMLREAGVPFFFATGVNDPATLKGFKVPVVAKPYSSEAIFAALKQALRR
jgi:AmiR/NasT family two-component response regulator